MSTTIDWQRVREQRIIALGSHYETEDGKVLTWSGSEQMAAFNFIKNKLAKQRRDELRKRGALDPLAV